MYKEMIFLSETKPIEEYASPTDEVFPPSGQDDDEDRFGKVAASSISFIN